MQVFSYAGRSAWPRFTSRPAQALVNISDPLPQAMKLLQSRLKAAGIQAVVLQNPEKIDSSSSESQKLIQNKLLIAVEWDQAQAIGTQLQRGDVQGLNPWKETELERVYQCLEHHSKISNKDKRTISELQKNKNPSKEELSTFVKTITSDSEIFEFWNIISHPEERFFFEKLPVHLISLERGDRLSELMVN